MDLALNNLQSLICHKTQTKKTSFDHYENSLKKKDQLNQTDIFNCRSVSTNKNVVFFSCFRFENSITTINPNALGKRGKIFF